MEEVHWTSRDEYAMKAGGLSKQLQVFSALFGMKLSMVIFAPTEQLSCTLQGKDTTVQEARNAALVTEAYLRRQRTDAAFEHFYRDVNTASEGITDEHVLPRRRKLPVRFDDGAPSFHPFIYMYTRRSVYTV